MNDLEKRAAYHRKRQDGLSPFCSLGESALSDITVYNGTNDAALDYSTIDLTDGREIGLPCGTEQACRDKGYKFITKLIVKSPRILQLPFDITSIWSSIELVRRLAQFELFDEKQLESLENQMRKCAGAPDKYHKYSALLREFFLNKGYNVISYVSEMEDSGSTSYILLDMSIVHSDLEERFNMRLDRKSIDKNRIDIARLLGIPAFSILIHENGRFEIHNISEDDARRYSSILRNKVKDIRLIPGKYDFKKIPMPGQMPNRLVTISGMLIDSLNEDILLEKTADVERASYKGHEMVAEYTIDAEEGNWSFAVTIYKNGKPVPKPINEFSEPTTFESFKAARAWIDKNAKPCTALEKTNQLKKLIDSSVGGDTVSLTKSGNKNISIIYGEHSPSREYYRWYLTDDFRYSLIRYDNISPSDYRGEYYPDEAKEWVSSHLGFTIEDDINDDDEAPDLILKYVLSHPLEETPFTDTGMGLNNFIDALDKYYGLLGVNGINQEAIDKLKDEYDCSVPTELIEGKKRKKGIHLNKNAGNVEHNINMFNHMSSSTDSPSNNPVSGPFGGDVSAPSSDGCCESLKETRLKEAVTKTVYRAEYYEPKLGKWISYYENSDVEKVKSNKDTPIIGNPKIRVAEYTVSGVRKPSYKFVKLVESIEQKEKYYMAKYRGVNTDRLHKVYFRCDGDFEDAENLLDELIAEPYTSARVLGTVSKAEAERDGFTKIGGTSGTELDDDFSMSTRTLW